jgi:four helix bundle protein
MGGPRESLEDRTERFALDVIRLIRTFPADEPGPIVKRQLAKSATSEAANYRASRRARSHTEFTSRIAVVAEEADESLFWLRIALKSGLSPSPELPRLLHEADELTAIFSKMVGTSRRNESLASRKKRG